ncbi:MAG: HD domain-containing protein [Elusimicrobia bacterium]|jgi:putative hydrolase of HD superfamily|nr:HD domain-containing protein [Elusimicrobiota bacterium]
MPSGEEKVLQWAVEAGLLKRVKRTGWWCSGVKDPESVAEHSHRMSLLAFYIAAQEGADPCKAASLGLFHDLPEARIGDAHAVVKRYWKNLSEDEARAREEQNAGLPAGPGRARIASLGREWSAGRSPEARAARDADYLECAIQALEYFWQERSVAREWVDSNVKRLQTGTGKRLGRALKRVFAQGKWEGLRTWWKDIYQR